MKKRILPFIKKFKERYENFMTLAIHVYALFTNGDDKSREIFII